MINFDYNTTREKLIIAEYGRNVQDMVKYICTLPAKEERNRHAQIVIELMGVLNPHLRDVTDFNHKLWDHLHIISEFKIDVDSPYPAPNPDTLNMQPKPLPYPNKKIHYKHYGKTVELMLEKAKKIQDTDRRNQMIQSIANFMKLAYITWNKDNVTDEIILNDLKQMSGGELVLQDNITLAKVDIRTTNHTTGSKQRGGQQQGGMVKAKQHNKGRQRIQGKRY